MAIVIELDLECFWALNLSFMFICFEIFDETNNLMTRVVKSGFVAFVSGLPCVVGCSPFFFLLLSVIRYFSFVFVKFALPQSSNFCR